MPLCGRGLGSAKADRGVDNRREAAACADAATQAPLCRIMTTMENGKLIIVPTPIGNLGDMTLRALDALREADTVCAEDTRVTGKLLAAFDIRKRIERLDEEMISSLSERIADRVRAGEIIAYCSDAGMPGVSDPGLRLVAAARKVGAPVEVLPGATAVATAYVSSGFSCPRFYFGGFFPRKASERASTLASLRALDAVALFYESPKRIVSALESIASELPHREVAVCRELTKRHEEVVRASSGRLAAEFAEREKEASIKGEIVIVIDAPGEAEHAAARASGEDAARDLAARLIAQGGLSRKDIAKRIQRELGISRNAAYEAATSAAACAEGSKRLPDGAGESSDASVGA